MSRVGGKRVFRWVIDKPIPSETFTGVWIVIHRAKTGRAAAGKGEGGLDPSAVPDAARLMSPAICGAFIKSPPRSVLRSRGPESVEAARPRSGALSHEE